MYEVAVLSQGKHFGELALTTNKPRAATVKCLTGTHLMVLSKHDYQKVLLRFEEANLNKFIDFLKQMPHFKNWTKNALSRLTYYMPKQNFQRHQYVFKEGDPSSHVYIVLQGEYEIAKKMRLKKDEKETKLDCYVGPLKSNLEVNMRKELHMNK